MEKQEFIQFMDQHENLKSDLFIRGFLITDNENINIE